MNSTVNGNYPRLFHIGIPKTGSRTIQSILQNDPRICLIRSRYFSTPEYWDESFRCTPQTGQIVILSEENLVTHNMNLGQIYLTLFHIRECNPNAHIIVTLREQRSMLISRFKYNFPYWHGFSMSLDAWLRTSEGMDYLGISMYSALYKTILSFFPENQIHFLLFEDLVEDQNSFMSHFYSLLGLSYEVPAQPVHKNKSYSDPELMFLARINKFKLFRKGGKISRFETRIFKRLAKRYENSTKKHEFFQWQNSSFFKRIEEDFQATNRELVCLGVFDKSKLEKHKYLLL